MTDQQAVKVLSYLYKIIEAGERGYAVSAANVNNRGLKVLFKSYAQQRARFKSEILAEIQRLGGDAKPRSSIRGILHRGRIDIFAAMTIGNEEREKVVLKEIMVGEKVALRTYEKTLKTELPPKTRETVARQYEEVRKVIERVHLMRGKEGKRLVIWLFDNEKSAEDAVQVLEQSGLPAEAIERTMFDNAIELYKGRGTTVFETIISGAVGGALWGNLIGALAGLGAGKAVDPDPIGGIPVQAIWLLVALAGIAGGAFIGGMLGFFIGIGISEEDTYLYDESIKHGQIILMALADYSKASEARRIMEQVNIGSKLQPEEALT